jgi:hypothetical protein
MSTPLDQFVSLSSALTGVNPAQLKPAIDPIGIAGQYLAMIQSAASKVPPATFDNLLPHSLRKAPNSAPIKPPRSFWPIRPSGPSQEASSKCGSWELGTIHKTR